MRVTELNKHPVLDVATATTVGQIDDVVIDPATKRVVGFALRKTKGHAGWLAWDQMKALGSDAATIDDSDALSEARDTASPALKRGRVIGGLVLTDQGYALGDLADVEFDAESGAVTTLVLTSGSLLAAESLRGIGSYAMIVQHPADAPGH